MPNGWESTPGGTPSSSSRSPGCSTARTAAWRRSGSARWAGRVLPTTVQAVIAARIDQLSPPARELVRRASVFPRGRFDTDELALIAEPTPELLAEAEDEELLVPRRGAPGRVAVPQRRAARRRVRLPRQARTTAGCTCGSPNRLSEPELADRYPRTIAFHLEQAARACARPATRDDRSIADRAVDALTRAGDAARRRIESRAAVDLYERALALAGPESGWSVRESWIVSMLGEARYWLGEFDDGGGPVPPGADPGRGRRSRDGARGAVPGRHHAHGPRRRRLWRRRCSSGRSRPRAASAIPACSRARC